MSGDYETHNDRQPKITYSPKEHYKILGKRYFHIYLNDKCLFKNLNEEEFDFIWEKIYRSYFKEELTYTECIEDTCLTGLVEEHSY